MQLTKKILELMAVSPMQWWSVGEMAEILELESEQVSRAVYQAFKAKMIDRGRLEVHSHGRGARHLILYRITASALRTTQLLRRVSSGAERTSPEQSRTEHSG